MVMTKKKEKKTLYIEINSKQMMYHSFTLELLEKCVMSHNMKHDLKWVCVKYFCFIDVEITLLK